MFQEFDDLDFEGMEDWLGESLSVSVKEQALKFRQNLATHPRGQLLTAVGAICLDVFERLWAQGKGMWWDEVEFSIRQLENILLEEKQNWLQKPLFIEGPCFEEFLATQPRRFFLVSPQSPKRFFRWRGMDGGGMSFTQFDQNLIVCQLQMFWHGLPDRRGCDEFAFVMAGDLEKCTPEERRSYIP